MDSEDKDYVPSKSEHEDENANDLMTEAKALWDNVWAYCGDCGEQGNASLPCKMCHLHDKWLEEVKESQVLVGTTSDWDPVNCVRNKEQKLNK